MNDGELLVYFAKWLNQYQKTDLIIQGTSLQKKQYEIKDQLFDFIAGVSEFDQYGSAKVLTLNLKFLAKRNVFNRSEKIVLSSSSSDRRSISYPIQSF